MRSFTRAVAADPEQLWAVLADYGAISAWASSVAHSCLLSPADDDRAGGVGVARRVQAGRTTIVERVLVWDEPKALAYALEGLPGAVRSAVNAWAITADGPGRSEVSVTTTVDCGPRPPQQAAARIVERVVGRTTRRLLDDLAARVSHPGQGAPR